MGIAVIKKRDGRIVPFDVQRITNAIEKSFHATQPDKDWGQLSTSLALEVYTLLDIEGNPAPTVEHVQDIVEQVLMREGYMQTAKNYILYRQERSRVRRHSDEDAARFGGASLSLKAALADCDSIEAALLQAFLCLHEHCGQAVSDFPQAMTAAVAGSFGRNYRRYQRLTLELLTGICVHETTQQAWSAGLAQRQLAVTLAEDAAALSREADLICGTLGCDRDTVTRAQTRSLRCAEEALQETLSEAINRLCAVVGIEKALLGGSADTPEAQLVVKALQ